MAPLRSGGNVVMRRVVLLCIGAGVVATAIGLWFGTHHEIPLAVARFFSDSKHSSSNQPAGVTTSSKAVEASDKTEAGAEAASTAKLQKRAEAAAAAAATSQLLVSTLSKIDIEKPI